MKVVQVLPDLNGGGVEKGTLEVARYLVEQGHESVVISAGGRLVSQLEAEGSRHQTWDLGRKSPLTFRHIWALRRWLRREKPDILHLRSRMPAWVCWLAWKGLPKAERPRLVTTVHGLYSVSRYSAIMCRGERVIAVSKTVESYIRDNYPDTDMQRVQRIYRGIEPDAFPRGYAPTDDWLAQWRAQYPQLSGKFVLTLPGRLTRLKGHHDFIDIVRGLRERDIPAVGLIVGGEDPKRQTYAQELYQRVRDENLESAIQFLGHRTDVREVYSQSAAVLSLSTKPESFGRTVLEALSQGIPVFGYRHGGVGEILEALYPQGAIDLGDKAAAVEQLAGLYAGKSPEIAVNDRFLLSNMLSQTLALYEALRHEG